MKYITKYITKILTKIVSKDLPKPMGRWNIDYCNVKIDNKVDLSNEDHCGMCSQYALKKINLQNEHDINIKSLDKSK